MNIFFSILFLIFFGCYCVFRYLALRTQKNILETQLEAMTEALNLTEEYMTEDQFEQLGRYYETRLDQIQRQRFGQAVRDLEEYE